MPPADYGGTELFVAHLAEGIDNDLLTLHGPHDAKLSDFYNFYPEVTSICISDAQCKQESMPKMRTVHHGIDLGQYRLVEQKQQYL